MPIPTTRFQLALCLVALLLLFVCACAPTRARVAVQNEQITLKVTEDEVVASAGPPELILARDGVETFYYKDGDRAVSVSLIDGVVVAFQDNDPWPASAMAAARDADKPVSTGAVRIGMSEDELRAAMGPPSGLTAKGGVETLHWLTDDEVDSAVDLTEGAVSGFWDRPVSEFTQNLPTEEDREESTTNGRIRAGMTADEVEALLGEPDGRSGADGVVVHRYASDPFFGDTINYSVGFKEDRVVDLFEFNVSRDEDQKEEQEEARRAAAVAQKEKEAESSILGFLANPLVQQALVGAVGGKKTIKKSTTQSTEKRTLTINGTTYTGGPHLGQPCSLDNACPSGYSCHLVTDKSGMCVQ